MKKYNLKKRIISATPILCVIAFLLMGFIGNLWHPGWIVFILIPIVPLVLEKQFFYPLLCLLIYLIIGFTFDWGWHPGWIIFLTIPVYEIFVPKNFLNKKREKKHDEEDDDD